MRNAVDEVGGAVQRVDDPKEVAGGGRVAALLGQDAVARELPEDGLLDGLLGLAVDAGDKVILPLAFDVAGFQVAEPASNHVGRLLRRPHRDPQVLFMHGFHSVNQSIRPADSFQICVSLQFHNI